MGEILEFWLLNERGGIQFSASGSTAMSKSSGAAAKRENVEKGQGEVDTKKQKLDDGEKEESRDPGKKN